MALLTEETFGGVLRQFILACYICAVRKRRFQRSAHSCAFGKSKDSLICVIQNMVKDPAELAYYCRSDCQVFKSDPERQLFEFRKTCLLRRA